MPRKTKYRRRYRRRNTARVNTRQYGGSTKLTSAQQVAPIAYKSNPMYSAIQDVAEKYAKANYPVAYQGYLLGKKAIEMLNAEKKYFDWSASPLVGAPSVPAEYVYDICSPITIGDGPTNRDGVQIRLKTIQLQMAASLSGDWITANPNGSIYLRYTLLLDHRPQVGTTPAYTDIFSSTNVPSVFMNIADQQGRWSVLKNESLVLNVAQNNVEIDLYQPVNLPVRYNNAGDVIKNRLFLMLASNEGTNLPTVVLRGRVRFYDN